MRADRQAYTTLIAILLLLSGDEVITALRRHGVWTCKLAGSNGHVRFTRALMHLSFVCHRSHAHNTSGS